MIAMGGSRLMRLSWLAVPLLLSACQFSEETPEEGAASESRQANTTSEADGDTIEIDIPGRTIQLAVSDEVLAQRRADMEAKGADAWQPEKARPRKVSVALQAYAAMTTSAARGAVRDILQLKRV